MLVRNLQVAPRIFSEEIASPALKPSSSEPPHSIRDDPDARAGAPHRRLRL